MLPLEVALHVAEYLDDHFDRAALCLASAPLGLAVIRTLPEYQHVLLSVALRCPRGTSAAALHVNEHLFRRYTARQDADTAGCDWLMRAAHGKLHRHAIMDARSLHSPLSSGSRSQRGSWSGQKN